MKFAAKKFVILLIAVILGLGLLSSPAKAVWHTFLDDHFNKDQQNPNLQWPWFTDMRNGIRWHWNPWPPHFRAEQPPPRPSDYCWGIQDFIFNTRITPQSPIQQSLWCAYTNERDPDHPRWPEDDDYEHNQNAWVWWGPVDLTDAVAAAVSYWLYLDLEHYARDSLTCFATADDRVIRTQGDDFAACPAGKWYSTSRQNDWYWHAFYLDSLYIGEDRDEMISILGEEEVYIGFVWHSDRFAIAGKGAFIDDVIFSWDDGLFDIRPEDQYLGYPVNQDSVDWGYEDPDEGDEIMFRCDYKVIGVGETPEFNIQLYLDDELLFEQAVSHEGMEDTVYTVTADTVWTVTWGEHVVRWELDTPVEDQGSVEEGDEDNNVDEMDFEVIFNPPPRLSLNVPEADQDTIRGLEDVLINYTIEDTLDDDSFRIFFYWTEDTTDLTDDPDEMWDVLETYGFVGRDFDAFLGEGVFSWTPEAYKAELDSGVVFYTVAVASDGYPNNYAVSVSPGTYIYLPEPEDAVENGQDQLTPTETGIVDSYPNPFNSEVNIRYNLKSSENVNLSIHDMSGRHVTTLIDGLQNAGSHKITWRPAQGAAGVYFLKLTSGTSTDIAKVLYMP